MLLMKTRTQHTEASLMGRQVGVLSRFEVSPVGASETWAGGGGGRGQKWWKAEVSIGLKAHDDSCIH